MDEVEKLIAQLKGQLKDPNSSRSSAATKLGWTGDARAVPALIESLKDEYDSVRWAAAWALIMIAQLTKDTAIFPYDILFDVQSTLKQFIDKNKKFFWNEKELAELRKEIAKAYVRMAKAVSEAKKKDMPGELLPGRIKPPKKKGIYRTRRSLNG